MTARESSTERPTHGRPRGATLLGALSILLAVGLAYGPSWSAGWLWDDDDLVAAHPNVTDPAGLARIWTGEGELEYFPLTRSVFWAAWRLWPDDPVALHRLQLLLHALAALAVWRLLARLELPGAWWAALLFAVHPLAAASVAWIAEVKNTLSLLLGAVSVLWFLRFDEAADVSGRRAAAWLVASCVAFALALAAKTSLVALPFVMLALRAWRRGRVERATLLAVMPHLALALGAGLVTVGFQHGEALGSIVPRPEGLPSRVAAAGWALWFYLREAFWPVGLSANHPRWDVPGDAPLAYLPLLAWMLLLALPWLPRARRAAWRGPLRAVSCALGVATLLLGPVLGLVRMSHQALSLVADHFAYPALPAFTALAVAGAIAGARRVRARPHAGPTATPTAGPTAGPTATPSARQVARPTAGPTGEPTARTHAWRSSAVAVSAALVLGALTWQRSASYRDIETACRDVLSQNDASWFAHNNLGAQLLARGAFDLAEPHLRRAIELEPRYAEPLVNLGLRRARRGDDAGAEVLYRRALLLKPTLVAARIDLGDTLLALGRTAEAGEQAEAALALTPRDPRVLFLRGRVAVAAGDPLEGAAWMERALAQRPDAALCNALGVARALAGDDAAAEQSFRAALALDPRHVEALNNLGTLLADRGQRDAARPLFERALAVRPDYALARQNLRALDGGR